MINATRKNIVLSLSESKKVKLEKSLKKLKDKNPGMSLSYIIYDLVTKEDDK